MKKALTVVAALAVLAGLGWAQAGKKAVNRKCPVKPDVRVDPAITVTYNGKTIGLCCTDCVDKWKKNPAAYAGNVKEDAHLPLEPESLPSAKDAIENGQTGPYLTVLFFTDGKGPSQAMLKALSDPAVEAEIAKCSYAKVDFKKDSEEAKTFKVTAAPTLLLLDPRSTPPKEFKRLTSAAPAAILKELQLAAKKLEEPQK
jgi:hypothetical protein